jgi:FkbH-like protein
MSLNWPCQQWKAHCHDRNNLTLEESTALKLHLISDFNLETLGHYLENDGSSPHLSVVPAPFGQVFPALLQPSQSGPSDFAVVWTSPGKMVPAFAAALDNTAVSEDAVVSEVRQFADCLRAAQKHFRAIFVVSWTLEAHHRGNGILSLKARGPRKLLLKMNLTLAEELEDCGGVYLLDGQRWMEEVGKSSYSPKLWYLTKTPFHANVFRQAVSDLKAAISAVLGASKKLLVVDLDNTLWEGVVGDLGWENLRLGGHDYLGEAFLDFQRALKSLRNRGIVLAIASKNEESVALEALSKHPEMVLRPEDFSAWRINWNDKAANIAELAAELNLGLQSTVFIDDNPVERARVREALPEVYVPEWPDDKTLFASRLRELNCFDSAYLTAEDASRHQMYATDKQRELLRREVSSPEDWLLSLETEVAVEELSGANCARVVQLLNKTNQMNLTTRRLAEAELQAWLRQKNRKLWAFRVKDKFGDSGLTGILSLEIESGGALIADFVLSCRVMGRNVEHAMVAFAAQHCTTLGLRELRAIYIPTPKNKPCLNFWMSSGFSYDEKENRFTWPLSRTYPFPDSISIHRPEASEGDPVYSSKPVLANPEGASLKAITN